MDAEDFIGSGVHAQARKRNNFWKRKMRGQEYWTVLGAGRLSLSQVQLSQVQGGALSPAPSVSDSTVSEPAGMYNPRLTGQRWNLVL